MIIFDENVDNSDDDSYDGSKSLIMQKFVIVVMIVMIVTRRNRATVRGKEKCSFRDL